MALFLKHIKNDMLYIFQGTNTHYKRKLVTSLQEKFSDYSTYILDCQDHDKVTPAYIDKIVTLTSLFEETGKIIWLKEYSKFDDIDYLYKLLFTYSKSKNCIFICDTSEKLRSNAKMLKFIEKKTHCIDCREYDRRKLITLVKSKLDDAKIPNTSQIASYILDVVDNDPFMLESEAEKIVLAYTGGEREENNLKIAITKSSSYTIWEYITFLSKGERQMAVKTIVDLLDKGENEYSIIGMIVWNLRLITGILIAGKRSDVEIAKELGYSPFSVKHAREIIHRFSIEKVTFLYERIIELDMKIKTGLITPRLGVILLSYLF